MRIQFLVTRPAGDTHTFECTIEGGRESLPIVGDVLYVGTDHGPFIVRKRYFSVQLHGASWIVECDEPSSLEEKS
jgi:hypothetical protein